MSTATIHPNFDCQARSIADARHRPWQLGLRKISLAFCLFTIAAISATDIWFAVANSCIQLVEQNPICMALIELDPDGFSFFILGKSAGTLMVILTLVFLHRRQYRHATAVTIAVTLFQIGLLTYLTLSDPMMNDLPNFGLLFSESTESVWVIE